MHQNYLSKRFSRSSSVSRRVHETDQPRQPGCAVGDPVFVSQRERTIVYSLRFGVVHELFPGGKAVTDDTAGLEPGSGPAVTYAAHQARRKSTPLGNVGAEDHGRLEVVFCDAAV